MQHLRFASPMRPWSAGSRRRLLTLPDPFFFLLSCAFCVSSNSDSKLSMLLFLSLTLSRGSGEFAREELRPTRRRLCEKCLWFLSQGDIFESVISGHLKPQQEVAIPHHQSPASPPPRRLCHSSPGFQEFLESAFKQKNLPPASGL